MNYIDSNLCTHCNYYGNNNKNNNNNKSSVNYVQTLIFFPRKITTMKLFVIAKYITDITSVTSLTIEQ